MTGEVKEALKFILIIPALLVAFGAGLTLVLYLVAWAAWNTWVGQ